MTVGLTPRIDSVETTLALTPFKNYLINGGFDFWQRGTTISDPGPRYVADRWNNRAQNNFQSSRQTSPVDGTVYSNQLLSIGSNTYLQTCQQIEFANFAHLVGKEVTFSMKVQPQNTSSPCTAIAVDVYWHTTQDISVMYGANSASGIGVLTATLSSGVNYLTGTFTVPATAKALSIQIRNNGSTMAHGDGWVILWAMLNEGAIAAPNFIRFEPSINAELAACQRYYEKSYNQEDAPGSVLGYNTLYLPVTYSSGAQVAGFLFKTTKRIAPAVVMRCGATASAGYMARITDNNQIASTAGQISDHGVGNVTGSFYGGWDGTMIGHYTADADF